ncbi:MAG TPA: ComEC/Rec2 family competence protein [Candidatus Saccharimonadales bacterium]|jgi:competence protein ComEC|nr:ComEC/Rec2 family competence protein [Candidatus Saccharimonadales bacterium]
MKLPSLFPVAFFAGGILLSIEPGNLAVARPAAYIVGVLLLLLCGAIALRRNFVIAAAVFAAGAWLAAGIVASNLERAAVPSNLASTLIESGKVDASTALRWLGRLRSDPLQLPWGKRYEINLESVETSQGVTPVAGGLRLTYYDSESVNSSPPIVRAGDRVEAFVRARTINNFGDPGSFDMRSFLAAQNIQQQGALRNGQLLTLVNNPRLSLSDHLARLRGRFLRTLDELFKTRPEEGALARAMLLGDRSFVDRDRVVDYQKTGVYHVMVLAGLHVGALAAFFLWASRKLHLGLLPRVLLTILALAAYAGIVEDRPPILRAVLMAAIFLSAKLFYRRMDLINIAAISALIILAAKPSELADASFLLSYSAIATIGAIAVPCIARTSEPYRLALDHLSDVSRDVSHAPRAIQFRIEMRAGGAWISAHLPRRLASSKSGLLVTPFRGAIYFWEMIFLSAILQLGMIPPLAYYFHRVTLAGPFANVPALVLTGMAVPIGFLMLAASLVSQSAAAVLAKILSVILSLLDFTVRWFASWHGASYRIPGPSVFIMIVFVGSAVALSAAIRVHAKLWLSSIAVISLLATAVIIAAFPFRPRLVPERLELTVLDVGQGDSLFLSFPHGRTMLVDGGGEIGTFHSGGMRMGLDVGEDVVSPYLWSRGIKRIDIVALTHAHEDHLGGLPAIFENFHVGELWVGRDIRSAAYEQLIAQAKAHGVLIKHLKQGDTFSEDGVLGSVLWPEEDSEGRSAKNDDSLVLRLTDGAESFLLAGDVERPSERAILSEQQPVGVNFLKVAHHGSKTSTTDAFLSAAHPAYAAISVGRDNSFGHPSPEVTDRLEAAGVRVYRTDRDGAITASTDGSALSVSTFVRATQAQSFSAARK